jgi:hypothetical protein
MIEKSLVFLQDELNAHLTLTTGNDQFQVELSTIVDMAGKTEFASENAIGLTLVNTEEEFAYKDQKSYRILENGESAKVNPEIKLNLYVLFSVHFKNYNVGLQYLSLIAKFFQSKRYFTPKNSPRLDEEVSYLNLELYTLNFEQINQMWGAIGAKYRPSVLYKVRMLTIHGEAIINTVTAAQSPDFNNTQKN